MFAMAVPVAAQPASNDQVESVTVTGLISSLQKNLDIKRDAPGEPFRHVLDGENGAVHDVTRSARAASERNSGRPSFSHPLFMPRLTMPRGMNSTASSTITPTLAR